MSKSNAAVQIKVLWGQNPIFVTELNPPRSFTIGEDGCDFTVPRQQLGCDRLELVHVTADGIEVRGPEDAHLALVGSNGLPFDELPQLANGTVAIALSEQHTARMKRGELTFEVLLGAPEQKVARVLGDGEAQGTVAYFGASLFSVGSLLAAMAFFVPPTGLTTGEDTSAQQLVAMQSYLEASAEREREQQPSDASANKSSQGGEPGAAAEGPSGEMGKPNTPRTGKKFSHVGPVDNPDPALSRLEEARTFGMIGLLSGGMTQDAALDVFARDAALGNADLDAVGNMWGDDIGESGGQGGLSLFDQGDGGGGKYRGIGLGAVRTIGGGNGSCKAGQMCAFDGGPSGGTHAVKAPRMRVGDGVGVSGRLPADVVQRLVRQNFGRFRYCYERGLIKNPNLSGRVAVRFLISRDGTVSNASSAGSSLPDADVTSCVVSKFYGLSFPKPENGTVSVTYPIMFSPG
jgi:hypothetical protein